ncbi:MAG: hypothetical protein LBJ64_06805 [Deltaproteobacteria bacterium]|jgi:transposase-like protein|nr:hypothetical protein [Deltaproteobacteria bacterium]
MSAHEPKQPREYLAASSCPNEKCVKFGLINDGNISVRGSYGKEKRPQLYCRVCGQKFAATRGSAFYGANLPRETIELIIRHAAEGVDVGATARMLDMSVDAVNDVIHRVGLKCARILDQMKTDLDLQNVQFEDLWDFMKHKKVRHFLTKTTSATTSEPLEEERSPDDERSPDGERPQS